MALCPPLSYRSKKHDFSVCSVFSLVRIDFQAPYMRNWKPEVLPRNFDTRNSWCQNCSFRHQEQLRSGVRCQTDVGELNKLLCPHFPSWLPEHGRLDIYCQMEYCENPLLGNGSIHWMLSKSTALQITLKGAHSSACPASIYTCNQIIKNYKTLEGNC